MDTGKSLGQFSTITEPVQRGVVYRLLCQGGASGHVAGARRFFRYTCSLSIHPAGEDQSAESVDIVHCPHCNAPLAIPEIVPVDDFACPECSKPVPIKMLAR